MGSSSTMTMRLKQKKLLLRENERGALAFYIDDWVIGLLPAIAGGVKSDESGELPVIVLCVVSETWDLYLTVAPSVQSKSKPLKHHSHYKKNNQLSRRSFLEILSIIFLKKIL